MRVRSSSSSQSLSPGYLAGEYVILRGQVLLHLDVRVVGADALGPLEQLLCGRGGVLPQQRVGSVRQHLLKWIG